MNLQSMVSLLAEHLHNVKHRPEKDIPLVALVGKAVLSPSTCMGLYSLYDDSEDPKLPDALILELILLRDVRSVPAAELAAHFNLDAEEVKWFFKGKEESTAIKWAGGLSIDTDQDAEDYKSLCSEIVVRWEAAQDMEVSYIFWTYLLGCAIQAMETGEGGEILEQLGTSDKLQEMRDSWDRNRDVAARWLVRRETDLLEVDDDTEC